MVQLCLLDTKNGEGSHQQGMPDRGVQDWLQSIKPLAMVLLPLPLLVTHADRGQEGPYLGHLHAPVPHQVLFHVYCLPPPPPHSPFMADTCACRWMDIVEHAGIYCGCIPGLIYMLSGLTHVSCTCHTRAPHWKDPMTPHGLPYVPGLIYGPPGSTHVTQSKSPYYSCLHNSRHETFHFEKKKIVL